eukprot:CAMPEP_0116874154 /NCGR_PEP_ID=MMETSP0463-20121206/5592_1 /TAXON_ID=181622 /ORGANISM="Strombidinopsis sp, Strain SopsisLIS2011" /LENGTH=43 /DNA_ID= /DNA_START= /DNA_END= /DNA_ORIENTATION=
MTSKSPAVCCDAMYMTDGANYTIPSIKVMKLTVKNTVRTDILN